EVHGLRAQREAQDRDARSADAGLRLRSAAVRREVRGMGARDVSAARGGTLSGAALRGLGVAALLAATAATQAPKVERRAYARLCDLRNELLSALLPAEPDVRRRVADLLAE